MRPAPKADSNPSSMSSVVSLHCNLQHIATVKRFASLPGEARAPPHSKRRTQKFQAYVFHRWIIWKPLASLHTTHHSTQRRRIIRPVKAVDILGKRLTSASVMQCHAGVPITCCPEKYIVSETRREGQRFASCFCRKLSFNLDIDVF